MFSLKLPQKESNLLLLLLVVYLLTRIPLLFYLPFVQDEALYAIMIEEQKDGFTLIPTFLNYQVSWKPPLFFWVYSIFPELPIQLEANYRFPSFLFGFLSIPFLYYFFRNCNISKNLSFFSVLIFLCSFITMYGQTAILTDSMLFFLICASLFVYSEENLGDWRFLLAGLLAFAAFFVKLVIAFMIPILAIAYFYDKRKTLKKPLFLLSLLAVPLAFLLNYILFADLATEFYEGNILSHLLHPTGLLGQVANFVGAFNIFLEGAIIWFALSLFGLWKHWKENKVMTCWFALSIFPLLTGFFMAWYFLPIMPAVTYFAGMALLKWDGKERIDTFFALFFGATLLISLYGAFFFTYVSYHDAFTPQKEAGLLISGKENVAIIGTYTPGVLAYKMLSEKKSLGAPLDVGWILYVDINQSYVSDFAVDYYSDKYNVVDGSFSGIFTSPGIYRKDTNISSFDYIVVVGPYMLEEYELLYNSSENYPNMSAKEIKIYKSD
ncbi:glycosyltransferase family 39 protein [Candidatus Micrarchaeota archaeon]|nr:glycosyltransferase family 39 protein [Candidatus Micrarchaeota archaeon]